MITLINGNLQNQSGLAVSDGSVSFQLNTDATIITAPYGIIPADQVVVFQFDVNGNILPNTPAAVAQIYSNAELQPQNSNGLGTYYLVTFYDANGARINVRPMWWQFSQAAGATVDISRMIAFATIGGNIIFYPTNFTIGPPGITTLGGIFSNIGIIHQWVRSINTDGTVGLSQPSFADISGTISPSQLPPGGVPIWNTVVKTAGYTAVAGDMVLADTSAGGFTILLPLSASNKNQSVRVKKISSDANVVTISRTGADLIDGQTTRTFTSRYTDLEMIADGGANWWFGDEFLGEPIQANIFDAATGFRISSAAPNRHVLIGNGTNYVDGTLVASDVAAAGANNQVQVNRGGAFFADAGFTYTALGKVAITDTTSGAFAHIFAVTAADFSGGFELRETPSGAPSQNRIIMQGPSGISITGYGSANGIGISGGGVDITATLTLHSRLFAGGGFQGDAVLLAAASGAILAAYGANHYFTFAGNSAYTLVAPTAGIGPTNNDSVTMIFTDVSGHNHTLTTPANTINGNSSVITFPGTVGATIRLIAKGGIWYWDGSFGVPAAIASGTVALGTSAIPSGTAATTITVSAPGVLATDNIMADFNADPTATTGYAPSATGILTIIKFCTAGNVKFIVENNTGGSITPGAVTLNWRVVR